MPSALTNATSSARFRRPSASSTSSSSGKWRSPLPSPWVSDAAQNPPLRPLAPQPTCSASSTATRREGSASSSAIAVHSPVNPPPMTATSTRVWPTAAGRRGPGSPVENQNEPPAAGAGEGVRIGNQCTRIGAGIATKACDIRRSRVVW